MSEHTTTRGSRDVVEELLPRMRAASQVRGATRSSGEFTTLAGQRVYLKSGPLRGKARLRHGLRARVGLGIPRVREYDNLEWLREHGFGAAEPLAAGVFRRGGFPYFQFLATRAVEESRTLRDHLPACTPAERVSLATHLGCEVARLHDTGFVHRDLFPRNLLITVENGAPLIAFIDAWRGGPRRALPRFARGADYDLACLMLYGVELFEDSEVSALLDAYFDARGMDARARASTLSRVARTRARLVRRLERSGRTNPPIPRRDWEPRG